MWIYKQIGKLITPEGNPATHEWYSGYGDYANKPATECLQGRGPLPRGNWTLAELINHPTQLGPVAIRLEPDAETRAYVISLGRNPDSFYIHDGDVRHDYLASEGCLVCMDGTVGVLSMWNSGDHALKVISGLEA